MQQIYYCSNCGAPVVYGEQFCGNCGITLDWGTQQVPPPPPQQPPYGYQYPDQQQQAWNQQQQMYNQQPGWNQYPPPYGPPPGYGMPGQPPQAMNAPYGAPPKKNALSTPIIAMIALIVILLVVGGIGIATKGTFFLSSGKDTTPAETTSLLPVIGSFSASSSTINKGESATLTWNVTDATSVSINQNIGEVEKSGSKSVSPSTTTTYTITAVNDAGNNSRSVTITVAAAAEKPVINSFAADRTSIISGEYAILEWDISNATSMSIDNSVGSVETLTGTKSVFPTITTTYTLTASNSAGSVTKSVTITVSADEPEIVSFTATPPTIAAGESSVLQWEITNATSVSINQGVGTVSEDSGTITVSPTSTKTYTITATNINGSITETVQVFVATDVPEITSFTADPGAVTAGTDVILEWEVEGAVTVYISQSVGSVDPVSGTVTVNPTATITYTLTATNSFGNVTDTVTVTVNEGQPVITSFTATPSTLTEPGSVILEWDIPGADTVNILNQKTGNDQDFYVESGAANDYISETTSYTITGSNIYGNVTMTITVTVTTP